MPQDLGSLKANGFIPQVQEGCYSLRVKVVGGMLSADELAAVSSIAGKFGGGYVHFTSRQSVEIPYIKLEDIDAVREELSAAGLQPAKGGFRVRTVAACQGSAICHFGCVDTQELARVIDEKYYGRELPAKLKIAVTGCRNNCLKAEANDIGVKGGMIPQWKESECVYCSACAEVCPAGAIAVDKEAKTFELNTDICDTCGKCTLTCKKDAMSGDPAYIIYIGGCFGNKIATGKRLTVVSRIDDVCAAIDRILEFVSEHTVKGERLITTLARVRAGFGKQNIN